MTLVAILALGFFLGMRHATDADHVVAVATIVSREGKPRGAMLVGALWGLGHTVTILLVGGAIVLFGIVIPPRLGLSMEFSVAVMLVVLGALNATGAARRIEEVARSGAVASSAGLPAIEAQLQGVARWRARPLLVGCVHGLAGSAAIALLVLATIRDALSAIFYLLVFGVGTVAGMALLTTAMAIPIAAASRRVGVLDQKLARATGLVSIGFGLFLAYQVGFVDGLFLADPSWNPR